MTDQVLAYLTENRQQLLERLERFLSIPSVSTDSTYQQEMRMAAAFVEEYLQEIGFEHTEIMETAGHPLVYGAYEQAGKDVPTVLFYGHYDVQPAEIGRASCREGGAVAGVVAAEEEK